ncbi:hypothetical protein Q9233_016183 [Columba guinea]|nr:hypothetical protein Q9233_016183 [Columba guinea]
MEEASKRSCQFWDTQPVPKLVREVVNTHGPVEPDKDNIRQEPYTLPQGFTWDALDLGDRGVVYSVGPGSVRADGQAGEGAVLVVVAPVGFAAVQLDEDLMPRSRCRMTLLLA